MVKSHERRRDTMGLLSVAMLLLLGGSWLFGLICLGAWLWLLKG